MKPCRECAETKSFDHFYAEHKGGKFVRYSSSCKECQRARSRARTYEHRREGYLKNLYGLSIETYEALLAQQGGKCAVCGSAFYDKLGRKMHVDHDHTTGIVRGILCGPCNSGLGHFKDSPDALRAAIDYLNRDPNP